MNNELFDKILKSELDKVTVVPSAGLKKAVGTKLFMQNVVVFHKVKAITALFVIGSATTAGILYTGDSNLNSSISENTEIDIPVGDVNTSEKLVSIVFKQNDATFPVAVNSNHKSFDQVVMEDTKKSGSDVSFDKNSGVQNNVNYTQGLSSKEESVDDRLVDVKNSNKKSERNKSTVVSESLNKSSGVSESNQLAHIAAESEIHRIERMNILTKDIPLNELAHTPLQTVDLPTIDHKTKVIVKEVSYDLYGLGKGSSDIDNSISSVVYSKYHWDFYKESDALAMRNGVGGQVNFAVGTPRLKFKSAIGVNTSKFIDTKAIYTYGEIRSQQWLDYFNTDELSWVNTYGEDSCEACMYASKTENFESEMNEEYNRYSYINIPLKAGIEVDLKRISVSAFGGLQLSQLVAAKGLGISQRDLGAQEKFYYWNDLKVTSLQDDNQLMKSRFLSYQAGVDVRVRILPKFDILAGYEFNASADKVTKAGNIVQKSLKYNQAKIGITFHPFRSAINPKF